MTPTPRSDFDIGDGYGETCDPAFVAATVKCLSGLGYSVTSNKYFAGAEPIHKHGDPANGTHSLQIETKRGLDMEEVTYAKRPEFEKVKSDLDTLCRHLSDVARSMAT